MHINQRIFLVRARSVIGTPDEEDIESIESEKARRYIASLPFKPPIPPERIFPNANPEAIQLLQRMLIFHPGKRITVEEALSHPYLASLHDPSDEPLAHAEFSFEFERMPLTKHALRELLTSEMLCFHPEIAREEPPPRPPDAAASMDDPMQDAV